MRHPELRQTVDGTMQVLSSRTRADSGIVAIRRALSPMRYGPPEWVVVWRGVAQEPSYATRTEAVDRFNAMVREGS